MRDTDKEQATARATQGAIARSAKAIERSADVLDNEADRRTNLASDRTVLAAERTYAAWVRTSLTALASGVGARALLVDVVPLWLARVTGSVLILFAAFCLCAAVWREFASLPQSRARISPLPRFILLPLNFFLLIVTLAALVGVWAK
jgi:putative membrane protein